MQLSARHIGFSILILNAHLLLEFRKPIQYAFTYKKKVNLTRFMGRKDLKKNIHVDRSYQR